MRLIASIATCDSGPFHQMKPATMATRIAYVRFGHIAIANVPTNAMPAKSDNFPVIAPGKAYLKHQSFNKRSTSMARKGQELITSVIVDDCDSFLIDVDQSFFCRATQTHLNQGYQNWQYIMLLLAEACQTIGMRC